MSTKCLFTVTPWLGVVCAVGCAPIGGTDLVSPLPGVDPAAFARGRAAFERKFTVAEGLGPLFNESSCAACHSIPDVGGSSDRDKAVFVAQDPTSPRDVLGIQRHHADGTTRPPPPPGAALRIAPPLFGDGLLERTPDYVILDGCALGGHFNSSGTEGSLVARFGWKPFSATVRDFTGLALEGEMGITNPNHGEGDVEVDEAFVADLATFVAGLAPPPRAESTNPRGEQRFAGMGCATCHRPDLSVEAPGSYTDLCLHAMGPGLADGILEHEALGDEFRTPPLWGLRFRRNFLHDGRADNVDAAIRAHGGDAAPAVTAYLRGTEQDRADLLDFLGTL